MNHGGWYSGKAVMKDLARATGIKHFDENALVIGERPPPSRIDADDISEEMLLRCGGVVSETITNESTGPDLEGITEMLRMVDTYDDINDVSTTTDTEHENAVENILTISKLNPNVKEFLPIASQITASSDKENDSPQKDSNVKEDSNNILKQENDIKNVNCAVQVNRRNNNESNLNEIKQKLKNKITSTTNATSVKVKHERNVAIMSLFKLYSQAPGTESNNVKPNSLTTVESQKPNSVSPSKEVHSLKLMPPNYYETSSHAQSGAIYYKAKNNTECINNHKNEKVSENLQKSTNSVRKKVTDTVSTKDIKNKVDKTTSKSMTNILSIDKINKRLNVDDNVQVSVDKVTMWLQSNDVEEANQKKKSLEDVTKTLNKCHDSSSSTTLKVTPNNISPKKEARELNKLSSENPNIYLGPVTFRRKEIPVSNSPSLSSSDQTITRKTLSSTYVPSVYANELSKTYMERANAKREIEDDIWSKLEEDLKRKDAISAKIVESNEVTANNDQDNSNLE